MSRPPRIGYEDDFDNSMNRGLIVHSPDVTLVFATTWNDRYILVKDNSKLLIDDVEYLGNWDFAQKGRLTDVLTQVVTDN